LVKTIKIQTGKKHEMEFFINTVPEEVWVYRSVPWVGSLYNMESHDLLAQLKVHVS
jgi:hypothetical protein